MEAVQQRVVKLKNMLSYGIGDLYGGGSFFIISTLFMKFLTDIAGITPVQAGLVVAMGKGWDAVTDPVMGYISDNTRSRFGRRKSYFLLGIIPIFISFVLLWISIGASQNIRFLYYMFAYILFSTVFTMVMIPYNTLGAEMTSDYKVRSKMTGVRMFFSQFAVLLGGFFPQRIIMAYPGGKGHIIMALIFGALFALPWILVYMGTWENEDYRIIKTKGSFKKELSNIFRNFMSSFKNQSFRIHILMYMAAYLAMDVFMALMLYFVTYYLNKEAAYSTTIAIVVLTQVVSIAAVILGCIKKGNAFAYRLHMACWALGIFIFGLFTADTGSNLIYLTAVVIGFGLSGAVVVPYNILPFISDVDEMITTNRREGVYAGLMTFIRKMAQAVALFLVGVGLDKIGYRANQVQNPETLRGLHNMIVYIPIVLIVIGIVVSLKFKINQSNHGILLGEISRLKAGGKKEDVDGDVKKVCEELTGQSYEKLWKS